MKAKAVTLRCTGVLGRLKRRFVTMKHDNGGTSRFVRTKTGRMISNKLGGCLTTSPAAPRGIVMTAGMDRLTRVAVTLLGCNMGSVLIRGPNFYRPARLPAMIVLAGRGNTGMFLTCGHEFCSDILTTRGVVTRSNNVASFGFRFAR